MRRLRISGLVKFAKQVRQELAGPVSAERLAVLRRRIDETIRSIEQVARDEGVRVQSLPLPSRKAYQFLKGLDLSAVVTEDVSSAGILPPESVSFRGLKSYFDDLLSRLARAIRSSWRGNPALAPQGHPGPAPPGSDAPTESDLQGQDALATKEQGQDALATKEQGRDALATGDEALDEIYAEIVASSESIEEGIKERDGRPEQIKKPSREMRAWLAYFSQRENFDEYGAAVRRAEPIFREACTWPAAKSAAVLVHFRPQQGMYHIRAYPGVILVRLPTPMICFDERLLRAVAEMAFRKGGGKKLVHDATVSEPYQRIASEMELLGGVAAQTRGLHHDLAASFDRVNAAYFNGGMSRPRLVWSRIFAARKFGHYEHARDTVMVNMVLDRKTVPESAVDFIVYHELLHKQLGIVWQSNRMAVHTPEFRQRERQFKQYDHARAVLRKLATER